MTGKHGVLNRRIAKDWDLTKEFVEEFLEYRDGDLYWKPFKAGTHDGNGYLQVGIKRRYFKVHRLIFLMHHGYLPDVIDHIDGNKQNNRIENLREATRSQNGYNTKISKHNQSGVKGVSWRKQNQKWRARIYVEKQMISVGDFDNLDDAKVAVEAARLKYHKQFARNK